MVMEEREGVLATEVPSVVLTFAATDPTGGAGLQADVLTLSALGCYALSVVTGITVQDTRGVERFDPVDTDSLIDQARSVLEDVPVDAFKIGVVNDVENIAAIAEIVSDYPDLPVVLDPVLASGRGDDLSTDDTVEALCDLLVPQSTIIIPNSIEARRLIDDDLDEEEALSICAAQLIEIGVTYVLITGSHEQTADVVNTLYDATGMIRQDRWTRLPDSFHGSGCTLASAVAANLALGMPLVDAVTDAQEFTWHALNKGFRPGMGQHIPDRLFWVRGTGNNEG